VTNAEGFQKPSHNDKLYTNVTLVKPKHWLCVNCHNWLSTWCHPH